MKKITQFVLVASLMSIPFASFASEIKVKVDGMVCAFCAQGITKKFKAEPSIEKIDVNLSNKLVTLTTKEGKTIDDAAIVTILKDSGYNVAKIER